LAGLLVFWQRGNRAKDRAAIGVGQGIAVQSQADHLVVQQLDYIEWVTLIWRVSDSPSASSAPLKGVLASSPNAPSH